MLGYGVRTMGLNSLTPGNISRISKDKIMPDKLMYIPNIMIYKITHYVDYNQWLKRLFTHLKEPIHQNSVKVHIVVKPTNMKTLGTSVINSLMSPPSLHFLLVLYIVNIKGSKSLQDNLTFVVLSLPPCRVDSGGVKQ